jgi:phage terminase small subunit
MPRKKQSPVEARKQNARRTRKTVANRDGFEKSRLSDEIRQAIFAREYVRHGNGQKAAIAAGYSPHTATEQASSLLTRPHILAAVRGLQESRLNRLDISADRVAIELYIMGTSRITDIGEIVNGKFEICDTATLDDTDIASIAEIIETVTENEKTGTKTTKTQVKLYNRLDALKELNRMLGIGQDMNTHISGLRAYGLNIIENEDGTFHLIDTRSNAIEAIVSDAAIESTEAEGDELQGID